MKPKPKARPVSGTARASSREGCEEKARGSADPAPTPLTMQEAVSNWLVWLGIMEVDDEPARFLPRDIERRILDNFMDLDPTDELTSALALTSMIQQLMASVGGMLQDAMQMAARRRQDGQEGDQEIDTEVEVEVETEEDGPHADDDELIVVHAAAPTPDGLRTDDEASQKGQCSMATAGEFTMAAPTVAGQLPGPRHKAGWANWLPCSPPPVADDPRSRKHEHGENR